MSEETQLQHQPPFEVPTIEEMGALLPQYTFAKLAAFGGMGAVYKAQQESLERPVAIKILPPAFGTEKEFAERFKSEARAMAKLNHTNIVAVYDFGITKNGHLYLVMEWVEGPTLHELIQKGTLPMKKAASLAMQLCDALSYAHNHRILHRDIKPGNIMVNQDEQVKVADFGLARPITGEAEENPYGTPEYAAPEILGKASVDQRADIFAAGIVLYEMLTGRVPKSPRRSVTEYAPLSPAWDHVIDTAIHPDPEKRFLDARDLRAHISNLVTRAEAAAVPVAVIAEDDKSKKKGLQPLHFALMGAVGVAVLGLALGMMFKAKPEAGENASVAEKKVRSADDANGRPKKVRIKPEPQIVAVTPEPEPQPEKKKREPRQKPAQPPAPEVAVVPAPAPPMPADTPAPAPAPVPPPAVAVAEDPYEAILKIEERDPELARLLASFDEEWSANEAIDTSAEVKDLAGKYIPALQRSLTGLVPEQRDHVLTEISHVANREALNEPQETWPPTLKTLRQAYNAQATTIQSAAAAAADQLRSTQCELLLTKAKERTAAGNVEAAKRAEAVAAALAKLPGPPSIQALKDSVAVATSANANTNANTAP